MMSALETQADQYKARFKEHLRACDVSNGQVTLTVESANLLELATVLRDEFSFEILMDIAGVDYLHYGIAEWQTDGASTAGFSRAVEPATAGHFTFSDAPEQGADMQDRFAVIYQLLSIKNNERVTLKLFCENSDFPVVPSVFPIWNSADWYERECFDLFGIAFDGHPDLRRILTDYGFVGHPFRKDFPLSGHVEMRYDAEQERVVYQPVTIEPRVLVPRVIRKDHRYIDEEAVAEARAAADAAAAQAEESKNA